MNKTISRKIYFLSFLCMVLLIFIHSYNITDYPLYATTTINKLLTPTTFIQYFLANGLLRFRLPLLMLMSGYLLAYKDSITYLQIIKKKIRTLLLPYLLFSAICIVLMATAEHFLLPNSTEGFWGKKISAYSLHDFFYRLFISPIPFQLWFLRTLFVFIVCYPVIKYCLQKAPIWMLLMLFILVTALSNNHYTLVFYFAVGIYLQMQKVNITTKPNFFNVRTWLIVVLLLVILKTWVAIYGNNILGSFTSVALQVIHVAHIIPSILLVWFGLDNLVNYCMSQHWFLSIIGSSFFIYACHEPLMAILIKPYVTLLGGAEMAKLIAFFTLPIAIITLCIGLNTVVERLLPKLHNTLTGGRGSIKNR